MSKGQYGNKGEAILLGLDSEKVFDRLSWPFLFQTLDQVGISGPFMAAIKGLYTCSTAVIRLKHAIFNQFPILNDTRQGCPIIPPALRSVHQAPGGHCSTLS